MAKKQTIILSHGSSMPVLGNFSSLGEVLVQHGSGSTETMLHTLDSESGVTSFPSTKWVEEKIGGADVDLRNEIASAKTELNETISSNVESLQNEIASAKTELHETISSNVESLQNEIASAKTELNETITSNVESLQEQLDAHEERLDNHDVAIADALTAATAYTDSQVQSLKDVEIKNLNDLVSELSATTKEELQNAVSDINETLGELSADLAATASTLQANIDTKADLTAYTETAEQVKTLVANDSGMSVREIAKSEVDKLEEMLYGSGVTEAIDTLKDVIDWIGEDASSAAKIVSDIQTLNEIVSGYTGTGSIKADVDDLREIVRQNQESLESSLSGKTDDLQTQIDELSENFDEFVSGRFETVESTYIKEIKYDGKSATVANNVADITEILSLIDGGTY